MYVYIYIYSLLIIYNILIDRYIVLMYNNAKKNIAESTARFVISLVSCYRLM